MDWFGRRSSWASSGRSCVARSQGRICQQRAGSDTSPAQSQPVGQHRHDCRSAALSFGGVSWLLAFPTSELSSKVGFVQSERRAFIGYSIRDRSEQQGLDTSSLAVTPYNSTMNNVCQLQSMTMRTRIFRQLDIITSRRLVFPVSDDKLLQIRTEDQ